MGPALVCSLCFPWQGAEKGTDRFYAWLDPLSPLKRKGLYLFSNLYSYRSFILSFHFFMLLFISEFIGKRKLSKKKQERWYYAMHRDK